MSNKLLDAALALAKEKLGDRFAFVGGGAVRDTVLGRPIKDIDVWILVDDLSEFEGLLAEAGLQLEFNLDYFNYRALGTSVLGEVDGLPVQLVALRRDLCPSMETATAQFDFGLCQISYDGVGLFPTSAFITDMLNNTMTLDLSRPGVDEARSRARYERLKEKYPEFTLVIIGEEPESLDGVLL